MLVLRPKQDQRHEEKKYTTEQIIRKLRKVGALRAEGATVTSAVKQIGVDEQTYYVWKCKYQGWRPAILNQGPHGRIATSRALIARYTINFSIGNYSLRG